MITARINGQPETFASSLSVSAFLEEKGYRPDRVAVEQNGSIVPTGACLALVFIDCIIATS